MALQRGDFAERYFSFDVKHDPIHFFITSVAKMGNEIYCIFFATIGKACPHFFNEYVSQANNERNLVPRWISCTSFMTDPVCRPAPLDAVCYLNCRSGSHPETHKSISPCRHSIVVGGKADGVLAVILAEHRLLSNGIFRGLRKCR